MVRLQLMAKALFGQTLIYQMHSSLASHQSIRLHATSSTPTFDSLIIFSEVSVLMEATDIRHQHSNEYICMQ